MEQPHEVELKYTISEPELVRAWLERLSVPGLSGGGWRVRVDRDLYFDTATGDLAHAGYAARIRRRGGRHTLALKSREEGAAPDDGSGDPTAPPPAALQSRLELEGAATDQLDPRSWPPSDARELLLDLAADQPLIALFEIRQRRRVREMRDGSGGRAEISLDHGEVRRGRRFAGTFDGLEVEARGGEATTTILGPYANAIAESGLATPEPRSKAEIAASLVAAFEDPAAGRKAFAALPKAPGVLPDDTLAEAGRKVLRLHMRRMLAMEPGTRSGTDPEDLHKMRVATRRMRAAWRVFEGAYQPALERRYVNELRTVAQALGEVRDLDVQLDGLARYRSALPEAGSGALAPLAAAWQARRDASRLTLAKLLDSEEYERFVEDYRGFTEEAGRGARAVAPNRPNLVREAAGGRIWRAYEQVRAHDATLQWADAAGLHALRIDSKRLRYTLECFREALPRQQVDGLIASVVELQDLLGEHNDADVAGQAAREFLVAQGSRLPEATRQALGHYVESRAAEMVQLRRRVPPLWRRLTGRLYRRTLAGAIASL